jgi:diacylglycerol kinase
MQPPSGPSASPAQEQQQKSEWNKFIASFGYALSGLWYALRTQRNARVHMFIGTCAIVLGGVLRISAVEFAMVFVAISGVFIAEMFNTVIEICIDFVSPDYHPLAKIAKDVAAGAVLLNAILSIIIGLFVFGPHLWLFIAHLEMH